MFLNIYLLYIFFDILIDELDWKRVSGVRRSYIWLGFFGVYSILGILDQVDMYKELTREAVFDVMISFMHSFILNTG